MTLLGQGFVVEHRVRQRAEGKAGGLKAYLK